MSKYQYSAEQIKAVLEQNLNAILEVHNRVISDNNLKENEVSFFCDIVDQQEKLLEHLKYLDNKFYNKTSN